MVWNVCICIYEKRRRRCDAIRLQKTGHLIQNMLSVSLCTHIIIIYVCINSRCGRRAVRFGFLYSPISHFRLSFRLSSEQQHQRKRKQNKNTAIHKPYIMMSHKCICTIWHAKAPHQFNCMQNTKKNINTYELKWNGKRKHHHRRIGAITVVAWSMCE